MADIYVPKGSMCMNCQYGLRHCEFLNFRAMPIILQPPITTHEDRFIQVKCTEYLKNEHIP